ncbi:MAG: acyltransferase family protein [Arenicella sp.]
MLGTLRFILAYFVFLSHFPESGLKLNLGFVSVIIFYFISGYLMMKSYHRFQLHVSKPIRSFYLDRCIKIFPQYLIVLLLTVVFFSWLGVSTEETYKGVSFDTYKIIFDAFLLPVNLAVGGIGDLFPKLGGVSIVPPAWSLSVEFHFYLLVPLLVVLPHRMLIATVLVSAALLTFSFFTKSVYFDTLHFGYRYIFPMLVVFIYGMMFSSSLPQHRQIAFAIWAYFCGLLTIILPGLPSWYHFAVQEITFGIVIALPVFHYAMNLKIDYSWFKAIDQWLGDLSYPVFLSHYLAIYLAQHLFGVSSFAKIYFFAASVAILLIISSFLALLQRYIDAKRINVRGFNSMRSTSV